MSKFNTEATSFRVDVDTLVTVNRIRISFKYAPKDFKIIVHKESGVNDIMKKYKDFSDTSVDITFSHLNLRGITVEMTKFVPTNKFGG
jgi:hypothetical protein